MKGRPKVPVPVAVVDADLVGKPAVDVINLHLRRLHELYPHPNRKMHYDHLLVTLLQGWHQPCDKTLRMMEDLSGCEDAARRLPAGRSPRCTSSDSLKAFDPGQLKPLLRDLAALLPVKGLPDPALMELLERVRLGDGSIFTVPCDVACAIEVARSNGAPGRQVRLNLQLDLARGVPADFSVSGDTDGSETAAFIRDLAEGVIYVCDRNFIDFKFLRAVLEKSSDFVIRAKVSERALKFEPEQDRPLTGRDLDCNIRSDRVGHLPGCRASPGMEHRLLREVLVYDHRKKEVVRLITNLLDVPAWVIAELYRRRWEIELFFRWFKCVAKFEHLFSHSPNGMRIQFYVAMIMTLAGHLVTGRKPGKYEFLCLGWVAAGIMSAERAGEVMIRRQRERTLNRARYDKRRAAELAELKKGQSKKGE